MERSHHPYTHHVSDKIRSIDWFKKSLFDDKSAAGNLAITASRAVLREVVSITEGYYDRNQNSLFGDRHQILGAQVHPQNA
jgi:hypothetical protein